MTSRHSCLFLLVAAFVAGFLGSGRAEASPVSTTVSFSQITMGAFWSETHAGFGITANGVSVVPASGAAAFADPGSVVVPLSGDSVTFSYGPGFGNNLLDNVFTFSGSSGIDVAGSGPANLFKLGTITFVNGAFNPLAFLDFSITTHSSDVGLDAKQFNGRIRLDVNSTDTGDPVAEADYFTIEDNTGSVIDMLGSVRVYDYDVCPVGDASAPACNVGSVDLYGYIDSLHLDHFANASGGAFINASVMPTPAAPVPEPATAILLLGGLLGTLPALKRRRRAA